MPTPVTDAQILKTPKLLAQRIEFAMNNILKAGARVVDMAQIRRVLRGGICKGVVGQVAPPKITGRLARCSDEINGSDVVYPIVGVAVGVSWGNYMALLIVGCVSRFAICSLIVDCKAVKLINIIIINDRIRPIGKPRRIIMDAGPPGMFGNERVNSERLMLFNWPMRRDRHHTKMDWRHNWRGD